MSDFIRGKLCYKGENAYETKRLTGTINVNANSSNTVNVNYPTNFNKNNTIVISVMSDNLAYNNEDVTRVSQIQLNNENISIKALNKTASIIDVNYDIVLMRIGE